MSAKNCNASLVAAMVVLLVWLANSITAIAWGAEPVEHGLLRQIRELKSNVYPNETDRARLQSMLADDIRARRQTINEENRREWAAIDSRQKWQEYVRPRMHALGRSLGMPVDRIGLDQQVLGSIRGDGFVIDKIVYRGWRGDYQDWITADLYRPDPPRASMPGILISHSHHRPKTQGEIQDMGMTWARAGCLVLAPDHLGHGERQQHGFDEASDFDREFAVSRQDYYFRYDNGIQLHLVGESLIGKFASDLQQGVALLASQKGADHDKIIVLGAVAGGAEPAVVATALDTRIQCVVPFNFGGPQIPGQRDPLPEDIAATMNYVGSGSWESTRNLRRSGAEGFLPWTIVASIAPRRLIYAHEFAWHRERDPIWKRLETIYGWYGTPERLGYAHGRGDVKLRPPAATHCTQIGLEHRRMLHPLLHNWFDIEASAESEYSARREERDVLCFDAKSRDRFPSRPLHQILLEETAEKHAVLRAKLSDMSRTDRRRELQRRWTEVLCIESSVLAPKVLDVSLVAQGGFRVERFSLCTQRDIVVPCVLVKPAVERAKSPVVVMVSQAGKQSLLKARAAEIAELVAAGIAVCLPDLRGCGETSPGEGRARQSNAAGLSSSELMLGETELGQRLLDLRCVLQYLRGREDLDEKRIALWGDSLAPTNDAKPNVLMPRGIDGRPEQSEPLGGTLVLLGALFEDDLAAVVVRRGLLSYASVLDLPHVFIPHDIVAPGMLKCGDLCDLAAAAAPMPLYLGQLVDGANRPVTATVKAAAYAAATQAYGVQETSTALTLTKPDASAASWLIEQFE